MDGYTDVQGYKNMDIKKLRFKDKRDEEIHIHKNLYMDKICPIAKVSRYMNAITRIQIYMDTMNLDTYMNGYR